MDADGSRYARGARRADAAVHIGADENRPRPQDVRCVPLAKVEKCHTAKCNSNNC